MDTATPTQRSSVKRWAPETFPISFWCGPPEAFLKLERFREIKEAGFTHVMPSCDATAAVPLERNRKILNLCHQVGLKAFIAESRMPAAVSTVADAKARLDAIVNDYKDHPALAGYFMADEPGAGAFPGLAEVAAYLREKDPAHPAYINMFPNHVPPQHLGAPDYEQYLRLFLEQVKPFVLSYDHYHFLMERDWELFFPNLATVRRITAEFGVPFWQIVLLTQHGPYRNPTEGELRYEAMQTLAYGGKGLLWFTYWEPDVPDYKHAIINRDGSRDPHYDMVKRINGEVRAIGGQLLNADSTAVFHMGRMPPGAVARPADAPTRVGGVARPAHAPIRVAGKGDFTIGLFRNTARNAARHAAGNTLALIANADYRKAVTTELMVSAGNGKLQQFNPWTGQWQSVTGSQPPPDGDIMIALHLAPGGAALLRW